MSSCGITEKADGTPLTAAEQAKVDQLQTGISDCEQQIAVMEVERNAIQVDAEVVFAEWGAKLLASKNRLDPLLRERVSLRLELDELVNNDPNRRDIGVASR